MVEVAQSVRVPDCDSVGDDYNSKTYFSGVEFPKEDSVLVARDEFQETKFHSIG